MVRKYLLLLMLTMIGVWIVSCGPGEMVGVISTKMGDIVVEFYPDVAPKHVESFKLLAEDGYYDGTLFHRVIPGVCYSRR